MVFPLWVFFRVNLSSPTLVAICKARKQKSYKSYIGQAKRPIQQKREVLYIPPWLEHCSIVHPGGERWHVQNFLSCHKPNHKMFYPRAIRHSSWLNIAYKCRHISNEWKYVCVYKQPLVNRQPLNPKSAIYTPKWDDKQPRHF